MRMSVCSSRVIFSPISRESGCPGHSEVWILTVLLFFMDENVGVNTVPEDDYLGTCPYFLMWAMYFYICLYFHVWIVDHIHIPIWRF